MNLAIAAPLKEYTGNCMECAIREDRVIVGSHGEIRWMGTVPLQQLGGGSIKILVVEDELFMAAMEFIDSAERIDVGVH